MRSMGFKPFVHRLPMRIRVWNLRLEIFERWEFHHFNYVKQKKRSKRPWVAKRAIDRAWRLRNWGQLFDPTIPF